MKKSKIKSFSPNIVGGQHKSWTGGPSNIPYYEFHIEMENGDKGIASSSKTEPSWKIGVEYTYEIKQFSNYAPKISQLKQVKAAVKGYNDPEGTKKIAMSVAQSSAVDTFRILNITPVSKEDRDEMAWAYYSWIVGDGIEDRSEVSLRWNAIIRGVTIIPLLSSSMLLQLQEQKVSATPVVIDLAEQDMITLNSVSS